MFGLWIPPAWDGKSSPPTSARAASGLAQGRDLSMRPPWWVRRALPSPTTGLGSPGGGQGQSRDPRLSSRRWASVAELDRGSPGLAGVEAAPTPTGQGWKGRGEQAGGEGQRDTPRWAHSSSAITVSPAPGRGLILARLDLPLHGKSLPFTARLMCSVGNAESGGGRSPLIIMF